MFKVRPVSHPSFTIIFLFFVTISYLAAALTINSGFTYFCCTGRHYCQLSWKYFYLGCLFWVKTRSGHKEEHPIHRFLGCPCRVRSLTFQKRRNVGDLAGAPIYWTHTTIWYNGWPTLEVGFRPPSSPRFSVPCLHLCVSLFCPVWLITHQADLQGIGTIGDIWCVVQDISSHFMLSALYFQLQISSWAWIVRSRYIIITSGV